MSDTNGIDDIYTIHSPGEELDPDTSSYLLAGEGRVVLIDPGPEEHVKRNLDDLRDRIHADDWLFVVIQSPLPGCLSSLRLLAPLTRKRVLVAHWLTAASGAGLLARWNVRTVTAKGSAIPLGGKRRLMLAGPPAGTPAGSLISVDTATGTLLSGPYFGSVGPGRRSGIPVLRRESVRAYSDLYTPAIDPQIVPLTFGSALEVSRIAPAHGKPAVGGRELIANLFAEREERPSLPWAFHRLYLRLAALAGLDAARGIYHGAGISAPDLETAYRDAPTDSLTEDRWLALYARMEDWLSSSILAAIHIVVVRISLRSGLPVPPVLRRLGDAIGRVGTGATGVGRAVIEAGAREARAGAASMNAPGIPGNPVEALADTELLQVQTDYEDLTDSVTGLLNETVFRQRLGDSLSRLTGEETSRENGAVLLVGLDNIQRINARYGRSGGDEALHAVAYLLRNYQSSRSRRGAHRLYKLRGPLFAYVLEEGSVLDGASVAEQIRQEIAESAMFLEQLTVSIGVIGVEELYDRELDASETPADSLVRIAIGRLSVARQSGMNTICSVDPDAAAVVSSGSSVLIADPDAPYLDVLSSSLRDEGFTVLTARDGADALSIVQQIVPAVIVSEVMLPKINGFSLREELRHSSVLSEIPFVLISQRKTDEVVEKASLLGIVHFLRKPFSLVELLGLIRNLSRRSGAGG
jgi:diguanylate cyclase (GGDEF)-like protein